MQFQDPLPVPPLTRFDVVMWFLRVQLWFSLATALAQLLSFVLYFFAPISLPLFGLQFVGPSMMEILVLLLFPAVLASSVLGSTLRDSVASLSDVKPLVGRCVGLALFVGSLGRLVLFVGFVAYSFVTHSSAPVLGTGIARTLSLTQLLGPTLSFFVGFALAFGPAIRDGFRAR